MARWFDEEEQIWVDENDESWTPERAARHEAKTGGGDSGGGGGGGGGDSGGGGGGGGTSTSQGESLSGQDQATQDLFRNTWGSEAESRWAWEREQTYGATSSSNQAPDAGMQVAPEIQQAHDYYSRQRTSLAQQGQDVRMQPDPIQQINQQIEAYQPPPASEPPVPYGQGTPEQLASARTDRVASEAATTAAKSAVAAGATPEQAATTAATAATAAALALDNRSLVGESAETQRRFRDTYGPEQAPIIWARQHTADLELQNRLYGQYEPPPGTQPLAGIKAQPMPDRRIRDQEGAVQTGPATLAVPPPPPPAPAQPSVSHPAPAAGGGRPMQPQTQAEVAQLGAATGQTAPPATPEQAALQQDLADVPPAPTPIGQLVNADAPSELILRTALPQAVDQTGRINPAFREHALGEIAAGSAEGDRLLEPVARAAWYRQQAMQGQPEQPPEMAPAEYIDAWRGMWKSVGSGAPLMAALKAELHANQLSTPSEEAAWGRNEPDSIRPGVPDAAPAAPPASVPAAVAQSSDGIPPYQLGADLTDEQIIAGRRNLAARTDLGATRPQQTPVGTSGTGPVYGPLPSHLRDPQTAVTQTDPFDGQAPPRPAQGVQAPTPPDTANPQPSLSQVLPETAIPSTHRQLWREWRATGGNGDWEEFRAHAQRLRAPDPGELVAIPPSALPVDATPASYRPDIRREPLTAVAAAQVQREFGPNTRIGTAPQTIGAAIAAGEQWAEGHLDAVAKLAWYQQTQGKEGPPSAAPADYIDVWKRSYRSGNLNVPLARALDAQLYDLGVRNVARNSGQPISQQVGQGGDVLGWGQQHIGRPYVYGGGRSGNAGDPNNPNWDCSSFVSAAWKTRGIHLVPHTDGAYQQLLGRGGPGQLVSEQQARPGDVVFYMGRGTGGEITHHMGIYHSPGKVLDQAGGNGRGSVQIRNIGHAGQYQIVRDTRLNSGTGGASLVRVVQPTGTAASAPQATQLPQRVEIPWGKPDAIVDTLAPHVLESERQTGVPAELTAAVLLSESSPSGSQLATKYNNFFGIKATPEQIRQGKSVRLPTQEYRNGRMVTELADFRVYDSVVEGLGGFAEFLEVNPRYREHGVFDTRDPEEMARRILKAGYATDPAWATKIVNYIRKYRDRIRGQRMV